MDIPTHPLENNLDLHAFFQKYRGQKTGYWLFRGHADKSWEMIPKAGRPEFGLISSDDIPEDIYRFDMWRRQAVAYVDQLPSDNFECLAIAQHHGFATRLLDWTENPLVAVFFACCEEWDKDGCVYCSTPGTFVPFVQDVVRLANLDVLKVKYSDILCVKETGTVYVSRAISQRILNQRGAFTVHNPPTEPIERNEENQLARLVIPWGMKWDILRHLNDYGINRATLFPDMDGLSEYANFLIKDRLLYRKSCEKR